MHFLAKVGQNCAGRRRLRTCVGSSGRARKTTTSIKKVGDEASNSLDMMKYMVRRQLEVTDEECCSPGLVSSVLPLDDDRLAQMAKALGHPARVRILRLLADRGACITGDLVAELPLAQSTVSEHLRILRDAGLIQGEIEGPRTSYCINSGGLLALKAAVQSL